jgi:hypothetical protein
MKKTYVDPPSGHRYGFPKELPDGVEDFRQWLIDNGYPESEVDFGMKYVRTWEEE